MPSAPPTRGRIVLAWIVVILIVAGIWKFVDYRNQPPAVTPPVTSDKSRVTR